MGKTLDRLREYLSTASKEQLEKDYEELKKWNDVGPEVVEYFDERYSSNCKIADDVCRILRIKNAKARGAVVTALEQKDCELYSLLERERYKYKHLLENSPVQDQDYRQGCLDTVEYLADAWQHVNYSDQDHSENSN